MAAASGALETETSSEVMDLLAKLSRQGIAIVIVTRESDVAVRTRRTIYVKDSLAIA